MSGDGLTVVLLPGATTDAEALGATLASVRAETGDDPGVVVWSAAADHGHAPLVAAAVTADVSVVGTAAITASARPVGFVRLGDRWRAGTLAARRRPLDAHPTAVLAVAGHHRVSFDGDGDRLHVPAPMPPLEPADVLLQPRIETSAVLVRGDVLDARVLELLHRPHGDAVVWSRLIGAHGHLPSGEIAADVRLDPERHGFRSASRIDAMLTADSQRGAWVGERVSGPAGRVDSDGRGTSGFDFERVRLETELAEIHAELRVRDATIRRLEAEVAQRDSRIRRLEEVPA